MQKGANINRIKAVLAEQNRTSKWLAGELGKDQATISKWCTNTYQPSLETLVKVAGLLNVDVRDLIVKLKLNKFMYKIEWDKETGGVLLSSKVSKETLGISPRPVWFEELDLLGLDKLGYVYPQSEAPLMWAVNKQYFYRGDLVFQAKGANLYDSATITIMPGFENLELIPIDVKK